MPEEKELFADEVDKRLFCRWLYKAVEKYFEAPDVQRRFEEWQKEQEKNRQGEAYAT